MTESFLLLLETLDTDFALWFAWNCAQIIVNLFTHCWELLKSVGTHWSSLLQFVMKLMLVNNSYKVMITLILMLPPELMLRCLSILTKVNSIVDVNKIVSDSVLVHLSWCFHNSVSTWILCKHTIKKGPTSMHRPDLMDVIICGFIWYASLGD
jgi:hypothetical protein